VEVVRNYSILIIVLFCSHIVFAQIIDIPNGNFKNALVNTDCVPNPNNPSLDDDADTNDDGEIDVQEALAVTSLFLNNQSIGSLQGIEYFANLETLICSFNGITIFDISQNVNLKTVIADGNGLRDVDLSQNLILEEFSARNSLVESILFPTQNIPLIDIDLDHNHLLTEINLSNLPLLEKLYLKDCKIQNLDVSNNPNLEVLDLFDNGSGNNVQELDLGNNPNLIWLDLARNGLSELDISNNPKLESIYCLSNQLTSFNISNNPLVRNLNLQYNSLQEIILKNGFLNYLGEGSDANDYNSRYGLYFENNPELEFICTDIDETEAIQDKLESLGQFDVVVNSYCSFIPGGDTFVVEGSVQLDLNSNGCDINDALVPSIRFDITDGVNDGSLFSDQSGNFFIAVAEGQHTITPNLEYPNYFTISPESLMVDFPIDVSPIVQDFCLTPSGNQNDLEIIVAPLNSAIPGFESEYQLSYRNKGNTILSGEVQLIFNDDVMDFISANQGVDLQEVGLLSWNYINLEPFETRAIDLSMLLNTPTDTSFPLNVGDLLTFEAIVTPIVNDELPNDNSFELIQTVVNSFDPNNKKCLEGDEITLDEVGTYVHYIIRFENNGTAPATNIVVKDVIDVSKYDINTLRPLEGSHNFFTRIDGNTIEFIFENIQLPFDDANNDGFILLKIKTLATLEIGDSFDNDAEIFFDFNMPILTEDASTMVISDELGLTEIEVGAIKIFPNPVGDLIHFEGINQINTILIMDIRGRILDKLTFNENNISKTIDVSYLSTGSYFIAFEKSNSKAIYRFLKK